VVSTVATIRSQRVTRVVCVAPIPFGLPAILPPSNRLGNGVVTERQGRLNRCLVGPTRAPPLCACMLVCIRAWPGSSGLPSPGFSHPAYSRTGRSAAGFDARLPVVFAKEAVMHITGGVKVCMALIVTGGAKEELASLASDPLSGLEREPHALASTTRTILRGAMRIDFDTHDSCCICLLFRELVDFAFEPDCHCFLATRLR